MLDFAHAPPDRRRLTGPVTKWVILVAVAAGGRRVAEVASQLTDVENNEVASRLPASAESTRALERLAPFQDPDALPTVVVYEASPAG